MKTTAIGADPALLQAFLRLPGRLYRQDPHWVPPCRHTQATLFAPGHPFHGYGEAAHFLVSEGDEVVGRISAMINRRLQEDGKPIGLLGFYEAGDDPAVAGRLFDAAIDWLAGRGIETVRGPINFSTWYAYRLVTAPGTRPPFLAETYSRPAYPEHWVRAGFSPVAHFVSTEVTDIPAYLATLTPRVATFQKAGYRFRPFDLARFDDELTTLHRLTARIFADNWSYSPVDRNEFQGLFAGTKRLLKAGLAWWAVDPAGEPVGFIFGYPDQVAAVRRMRGESHAWAKLRYLTAPKPQQVVLKTLGVVPEARSVQVASALAGLFHQETLRQGYTRVVHALMHVDNHSRRLSAHASEAIREYAVYERPL